MVLIIELLPTQSDSSIVQHCKVVLCVVLIIELLPTQSDSNIVQHCKVVLCLVLIKWFCAGFDNRIIAHAV